MPAPHDSQNTGFREWLCFGALLVLTAVVTGSASALFLALLDTVTRYHGNHPRLLLALPLAGVAIVAIYQKWGANAGGGNHLLLEEIHEPQGKVPLRMAPLVLFTTLVTHLFGGSAGREGTAVQMGGSLAAGLSRCFDLVNTQRKTLLLAGMAAGFGAVFGTPWAGAVFAIEVPGGGCRQWRQLPQLLCASFAGHFTCLAWGIVHTDFRACGLTHDGLHVMSLSLVGCVIIAAIAFGLTGHLFVSLSHAAVAFFERYCINPLLRAFLGGVCIIVMVQLVGSTDYLGLGVVAFQQGGVSILSSFQSGGADNWSWFWKITFTVITLASGFKGGEVTPLFFIGATLGNVLAAWMGQPVALFAGLGLIAVFSAAAKTPLACTLLGCEIFGLHYGVLFALGCFVSFLASGSRGIYHSSKCC